MENQYQIAKGVVARKNQDSSVILMKMDDSSIFYRIDGIASEVWNALADKKSSNEVISEMEGQYPQFSLQLNEDVPKFLTDLLEKKLVDQFKA
jgi:hypothetical protein